MVALLRSPITVVWVALVALTGMSLWLGTDHGFNSVELASVVVLVVAFIKVRLVGMYFMELRDAPIALRALFEGWCIVVCIAVVTMFIVLHASSPSAAAALSVL